MTLPPRGDDPQVTSDFNSDKPGPQNATTPARAAQSQSSSRSKTAIAILIGIVLAALIVGLVYSQIRSGKNDRTVSSSTEEALTPLPIPTPKETDASLVGCATTFTPIVPVRMEVPQRGWDIPVIQTGLDSNGSPAAPPKNEPGMASWWTGSPMPGSAEGMSTFMIHTYRNGGALGNYMLDKTIGIKDGDIIRVHGEDGTVLCYKYTHQKKIFVSEYDKDSDDVYRFNGTPGLDIVVCDDFDWNQEEWLSRVVFYADLIDPTKEVAPTANAEQPTPTPQP